MDCDRAVPTVPVGGIVDTHVHFFDRDLPGTDSWWPYLQETDDGLVGGVDVVQPRRFTPVELCAEGERLARLRKCVHVESAHGAEDPVLETEWLAALRDRFGAPHAAVVRVPLDSERADGVIDAQLAYPFVRGVRDPGKTSQLDEGTYVHNVRSLAGRDLVFELYCSHRRFADLQRLAAKCPETQIVLEHFGLPPRPGDAEFASWRTGLEALAGTSNIVLKLSGLGLMAQDWKLVEARVLVDTSLGTFGANRCMFGSNFPVDKVSSSYPDAVVAVSEAMRSCSKEERRQVFSTTAERIYRI